MKRILLSLVLTFAAATLMAQNPYLSLEGVVTLPDGSLQRFSNPKFPEEYIANIHSVLAQKDELFKLL